MAPDPPPEPSPPTPVEKSVDEIGTRLPEGEDVSAPPAPPPPAPPPAPLPLMTPLMTPDETELHAVAKELTIVVTDTLGTAVWLI